MVTLETIMKSFDTVINKCSNDEAREKLKGLSATEKRQRLEGKLNPFEEEDYKNLVKDLEFWKGDEHHLEKVEKLEKKVFNYEKRIFQGWNLEKNIDRVPSYNPNDFNEEKQIGDKHEEIYPLEESQLNYQAEKMIDDEYEETVLTDAEINALNDYFGSHSSHINSELSPRYNHGLWGALPSEVKEEYHNHNKDVIKGIDSAMKKSPGLEKPTVLYHGVIDSCIVSINNRVGDRIHLDSYISTSYEKDVGESYGAILPSRNRNRLYVKFLAPSGTRGIGANDKNVKLTRYTMEHEYLLDRNQDGTIVDINYDTGEVTVLLDK